MTFKWKVTSIHHMQPCPISHARKPRRLPSTCASATGRDRIQRRRHLVTCSSSAPQHWRTVPANQYGTGRSSAGEEGALPGPVVAVGWALAAMVAFNALRAVVLMWVRSQPRRPDPPEALPAGPSEAPTAAAVSEGRGSGPASPGILAAAAPGREHPDPTVDTGLLEGDPVADGAAVGTRTSQAAPTPKPASALTSASPSWVVSAEAPASSGRAAAPDPDATAATAAASPSGGSLQVASYQLRARGSRSNNNLGRVVICATLDPDLETGSGPGPGPGSGFGSESTHASGLGGAGPWAAAGGARRLPWTTVEWHQRFWDPLISKYAETPEDRVTGLLLLYGKSILHILEGDNNQLFALLRELRPGDVGVHRLTQIRVPCYILDLRERLFDQWMTASAHMPASRGRALRAALRAPTAASAAAAMGIAPGSSTAAAAAMLSGLPPRPSEDDAAAGAGAVAPPSPQPDQQLMGRIQQLELFVKFVGPKLSAMVTQEARGQALRNLPDYETTTPPEEVVAALATDSLAPALHDFVSSFDADYRRYVSLLAMVSQLETELQAVEAGGDDDAAAERARVVARAASVAGEIRQLARFYDEHVKRELKEALALRAEERRSRGADEVARRLSRGMRLRVNSDGSAVQAAAS